MLNTRIFIRLIFGAGLALFLLISCTRPSFQSNEPFPDREIVFLTYLAPGEYALGFIHPDGTGLITRTLQREFFPSFPTWGTDGKSIALRGEALGGGYFTPLKAYALAGDGQLWGGCNWIWHFGRVWLTPHNKLLMADVVAEDKPERIVLADPATCQIEQTLFEASYARKTEALDSAALSEQSWLAFGRLSQRNGSTETSLWVIDPISQTQRNIAQGLAPAWSNDGNWLAYTALDGIYVIKRDGTQNRRVVAIDSRSDELSYGWSGTIPVVSWSTDDQYLIYSQLKSGSSVIYKVDVATGLVTEVYKGGFEPNWRRSMPEVTK